ncbi:uncharacterized protein LOC132245503 [Alligator mississippiensis]|uniref:uncharacterized protein LOC132245503 n=1 Tax=Alligator mississippiensis TaxID=8496 RepID=UPI002877CA80|nr:uncharacterized protein LOC132245503 [Alligator mississippiensis]
MPPLVVDLLSLVPERGLGVEGPLCPLRLSSPTPRWGLCLVFPGSLTGVPAGSIPVPSLGFPPALVRFPHWSFRRLQSGSFTGASAGSNPVPSLGSPPGPRSLCQLVPSYLTGGSSWPSLWAPPWSFCQLPRQFRRSSPAARLSPPPLLPAQLQPVRPTAKAPCGGPVPLLGFLPSSTSSRHAPPLSSGPRFISPEWRLSLTSLHPSCMKARLTSRAGGSPACTLPLLPSPAEHTRVFPLALGLGLPLVPLSLGQSQWRLLPSAITCRQGMSFLAALPTAYICRHGTARRVFTGWVKSQGRHLNP